MLKRKILAACARRAPGYPLQVRHTQSQRTSGFPLLSLAEAPTNQNLSIMKLLDKKNLKELIQRELDLCRQAFAKNEYDLVFSHLERVHIISQPFPIEHTVIHFRMLTFAIKTLRPLEILVQFFYTLFSGKFSMLNIFPPGNTGGASALTKGRMAIPKDIENEMRKAGLL